MKYIFITVLCVWYVFTPIKATVAVIPELPVIPVHEKTVEEMIEFYFGDEAKTMTAIFMAESKLNPEAKNWNCQYTNEAGKKYSTSCKKEDRAQAWSVDCSIAQINVRGTECPKELMNIDTNLAKAREIYTKQGLTAWSVYNNNSYRKYIK